MNYPLETILLPMGGNTVKDEAKMDALWDDPNYVAEEKYDGSRYLSVGGRLFSRKVSVKTGFPVEKTKNAPHLAFLKRYPLLILDGEVYRDGVTSSEVTKIMGASAKKACMRQGFGELKHSDDKKKLFWRLHDEDEWVEVKNKEMDDILINEGSLDYIVFDILRDMEGNWLMDKPWKERRAILENVYHAIQDDNANSNFKEFIPNFQISQVEDRPSKKRDFYGKIVAKNGEGVMLKNINATYFPDKKPAWNWIKVKKHITVDVVIMGFKPAVKDYEPLREELIETHPYWEAENGQCYNLAGGKADALEITDQTGMKLIPVTKFYYYGWVGAVTFGQWKHSYTDINGIERTEGEVEHMCDLAIDKGYSVTLDEFKATFGEESKLVELGYFSGINEELRKDMTENPSKYIGECVEIGAMEQTKDGFYRHPQFSRMRPDKNARDCIVGVD